jgi:hypothetical protein
MIRQRISTVLTTFSLVLSLAAVSGAVPAATLAATPNVTFGAGALGSSQATGATAPIVGTGEVVGFNVWAKNAGTSNISQFYLTILAPSGASVYKVIPSSNGTCDTDVPTHCTFGQLKPNKSATVSIAYYTAPSYVGDPPTLAPGCALGAQPPGSPLPTTTISVPGDVQHDQVMCVNFVWSTVGFTTSDPGTNSRGDVFQWHDGVALSSSADFGGHAFFDPSVLLTVENDQDITATNKQATSVTAPAGAHFAYVSDGGSVDNCTSEVETNTFDCTDLFGQTSIVNVDNNAKFSQYFVITIKIDASLVEVPKSQLLIWHSYLEPDGTPRQELITASCTKAPTPCILVTTGPSYWTIEIHTYHNGLWRTG